jgi:hypothetical protein
MAWTATPKTWAAGTPVPTAAEMNANIRDFANAFGVGTSYTPTLGGFTLGNGTMSGRWWQIQKLVIFTATFTMGSSSNAASAAPTCTLPVTSTGGFSLLRAYFTDAGTASYAAIPFFASTTVVAAYGQGTNGVQVTPSTTSPFTWTPANGDSVTWQGIVEAA